MFFNIIAGFALLYFCLRDCCFQNIINMKTTTSSSENTTTTTSRSSLNSVKKLTSYLERDDYNMHDEKLQNFENEEWVKKSRVISFELPLQQQLKPFTSRSTLPSFDGGNRQ